MNYVITGSGKLSVVIDGESYTVNPGHLNYAKLKDAAINNDVDTFLDSIDVPKALSLYTDGEVEIKNDGEVLYNGTPVKTSLATRLFDLANAEVDVKPWVNFLKNLMQNPSKRAITELYTFLEHKDLPLTSDGCFVAYKRIKRTKETTEDGKPVFVDCYSQTIKQSVGDIVEVDRNTVDDDFGTECSQGLHVGSMKYVASYCSADQIVMVKINPADVVSVPVSEDARKCRVCKYEIVGLYNGTIDSAETPVLDEDDDYFADPEDDDYYDDEDDEDDEDYDW